MDEQDRTITTNAAIPLHWQIFIGHKPKNIGHQIKI